MFTHDQGAGRRPVFVARTVNPVALWPSAAIATVPLSATAVMLTIESASPVG
jgi:hypothetical protein